jgi:DeoR/GlpR family transcriptional regulator of sugar metabolism
VSTVAADGPHDRLPVVQQRIGEHGSVRIAGLAEELGVSEMTIRRDLEPDDERLRPSRSAGLGIR